VPKPVSQRPASFKRSDEPLGFGYHVVMRRQVPTRSVVQALANGGDEGLFVPDKRILGGRVALHKGASAGGEKLLDAGKLTGGKLRRGEASHIVGQISGRSASWPWTIPL
jgi:hypothetical protein